MKKFLVTGLVLGLACFAFAKGSPEALQQTDNNLASDSGIKANVTETPVQVHLGNANVINKPVQGVFATPKTESEMEALRGQAATWRMDPPPNDLCVDAQLITGPYPVQVTGTMAEATVDCPGLLDWNAVLYEITLPYANQTVVIDWCDDPEPWDNYGIILMDDCACDDYLIGSYGWTCANGNLENAFNVAGPGTILFPHFVEDYDLVTYDFVFNVNVTEVVFEDEGDSCVLPYVATPLPYEYFGTTADNTDTYGNAAPDEWHQFDVTIAGNVQVTLCNGGTTYDSYLYLLADDCATLLASNDDFCSLVSEINAVLPVGTYNVAVDGYSSNAGPYQLNIVQSEPCELTCPPEGIDEMEEWCYDEYVDVTNGGCNSVPPVFGAIDCEQTICGTSGTFMFGGVENRDTDWFWFTLAEDATVTLTGEAEFSYLLGVVTGVDDCVAPAFVASATGEMCEIVTVTTNLMAGNYAAFAAPYVFSGVPCGSDYYFSMTCVPWTPGQGDLIETAVPFDLGGPCVTGTTLGLNDDYDEICPYSGSTSPDMVYSFYLDHTATLSFDICNSDYDSKIYVYNSALALMGCNDDFCNDPAGNPYRSFLEIVNMPVDDYYIIIDGYGGAAGNHELCVSEAAPCEVVCPPEASPEGEEDCYDEYVDVTNGGCNSEPDVFGTISCDEIVCGTSGTYTVAGGDNRDTDWYQFTLDTWEATAVTLSGEAEFDAQILLVDATDCLNPVVIASASAGPCEPMTFTVEELPMGDYVAFISPTVFTGVECGSVYWMSLGCVEDTPFAYGNCQMPPTNPDGTWSFGTAHNDGAGTDYYRAERFGNAGVITDLQFVGLSLIYDAGWFACEVFPMDFHIDFYTDVAGAPGTLVHTEDAAITGVFTGDVYAGVYNSYAFDLTLSAPVNLVDGWVGLQSYGDPAACWFLWASTEQIYDGSSYLATAGVPGAYFYDNAFCLTVGAPPCDPPTVEISYSGGVAVLTMAGGDGDFFNIYKSADPYTGFVLVATTPNAAGDDLWIDPEVGNYFYQVTSDCQ